MIARVRILLPFTLSVRQGDRLKPEEFAHGDYTVRIWPPCVAAVDLRETQPVSPVPIRNVLENLVPGENQVATTSIRMDGVPTIQANLLQIDFTKPEFDRRRLTRPVVIDEFEQHGDPSMQLAFAVANSFMARVRAVTRASQIRRISPRMTFWRLDYLTDSEEQLPLNPALFRRRQGAPFSFRVTGINEHIWTKTQALPPNFELPTWETLLLDSEALLPEVGPAIVLAYAALETFITWALDVLAPTVAMPNGLWGWINNRGDWYKDPSVSEQFDRLLQILGNRSLKEDNRLWESLMNLKKARDSFVHQGKPVVGGRDLASEQAAGLVAPAKAIIDWVEELLPAAVHRPKLEKPIAFTFEKALGWEPEAGGQPPGA